MNDNPLFRRIIMFGAPIFTALVLLFHPSGGIPEPGKAVDVFGFIAPVADRFVVVHLLFAPALGLLGLAMYFLLRELHGRAATISRAATAVSIVLFIMYESIVGSATGNLVRTSLALPSAQQAIIADAASRLWTDPILGDFPAIVPVIAFVGWTLAMFAAAIALGRSRAPIPACVLLALSSGLTFHALLSGPIAMLCFLLAALWVDRARENTTRTKTVPSPTQMVA